MNKYVIFIKFVFVVLSADRKIFFVHIYIPLLDSIVSHFQN